MNMNYHNFNKWNQNTLIMFHKVSYNWTVFLITPIPVYVFICIYTFIYLYSEYKEYSLY